MPGIVGLITKMPREWAEPQLLRMVEALAQLPDLMREVVVLKHCQGMTLQQIGERIGRSVPAVASLLRRGLKALRDELKDEP